MQIGEKLFKFELKATDGETYSNFSYADRTALLIIVTCNHCPYARAYWSRIKKLNHQYEEDNLGVIAINPNDANQYPEDSFEKMVSTMKQLDATFVYAHD